MATRLYPGSSGTPAITPSFNGGSIAWELTSGVSRYVLGLTQGATAFASIAQGRGGTSLGTAYDVLCGQWISAQPLGAQAFTTSDTFKSQFRAMENFGSADMVMQIVVWIAKPDGTSRGVLYSGDAPTVIDSHEFAIGSLQNRTAPRSAPVNFTANVTASDGDYLVIEVGYRSFTGSSSRTGTIEIGGNGGTDLPSDETTNTQLNCWFETSVNIAWSSPAKSASDSGAGTDTATLANPNPSAADTGAGSDAAVVGTAKTESDSGSGADSVASVNARLSVADSGTGVDDVSVDTGGGGGSEVALRAVLGAASNVGFGETLDPQAVFFDAAIEDGDYILVLAAANDDWGNVTDITLNGVSMPNVWFFEAGGPPGGIVAAAGGFYNAGDDSDPVSVYYSSFHPSALLRAAVIVAITGVTDPANIAFNFNNVFVPGEIDTGPVDSDGDSVVVLAWTWAAFLAEPSMSPDNFYTEILQADNMPDANEIADFAYLETTGPDIFDETWSVFSTAQSYSAAILTVAGGTGAPDTTPSAADTGAGTDATSLHVSESAADSGSGTDSAAEAAALAASDAGTSSDGATASASVAPADAGTGSDSFSLSAALTTPETGSGSDSASPAARITADDAGTAIEAATLGAPVQTGDGGSGSDDTSQHASVAASDTGTDFEDALLAAVMSIQDDAASVDGVSVMAFVSADDNGSAADDALYVAHVTESDSGSAVDDASFFVVGADRNITINESGSGADATIVRYTAHGSEAAAGVDGADVTKHEFEPGPPSDMLLQVGGDKPQLISTDDDTQLLSTRADKPRLMEAN